MHTFLLKIGDRWIILWIDPAAKVSCSETKQESHLGVALLPKMSRTIASPIHAEAGLGSVSAFTAPTNPSGMIRNINGFFHIGYFSSEINLPLYYHNIIHSIFLPYFFQYSKLVFLNSVHLQASFVFYFS
jgi:hypothetical protein